MKEATTTRKVGTTQLSSSPPESGPRVTLYHAQGSPKDPLDLVVAAESEWLRAIEAKIDGDILVECVIDTGSEIIAMSEVVWMWTRKELNLALIVNMESANGTKDNSLGIMQNLCVYFGTVALHLQCHVVRNAGYDILLGRPFDTLTCSMVQNYANGDQAIMIWDPNNMGNITQIPTHERDKPKVAMPKQGFRTSRN